MQADTVYRQARSSGYPTYPAASVLRPPPNRQAPLFPPRFGLAHGVPTIMDVLQTVRIYPDARSATSGFVEPGYSGASRPANSWW